MYALKRTSLALASAATLLTLGWAVSIGADEQRKAEGAPQIAHFDVSAAYIAASPSDPVIEPAKFRIRIRGTIFVPENTRVTTKYLTPLRPTWVSTETYGPSPKGKTVEYAKTWDVNAQNWNGRSFTAKLMATSSAGVATKESSVLLKH